MSCRRITESEWNSLQDAGTYPGTRMLQSLVGTGGAWPASSRSKTPVISSDRVGRGSRETSSERPCDSGPAGRRSGQPWIMLHGRESRYGS